jgi:hypothetical protein
MNYSAAYNLQQCTQRFSEKTGLLLFGGNVDGASYPSEVAGLVSVGTKSQIRNFELDNKLKRS